MPSTVRKIRALTEYDGCDVPVKGCAIAVIMLCLPHHPPRKRRLPSYQGKGTMREEPAQKWSAGTARNRNLKNSACGKVVIGVTIHIAFLEMII